VIYSAGAIAIAAALTHFVNLATIPGAYPFWATQALLVGAAVSALTASHGKTRIASSYAEDVQAGQHWFSSCHRITTFCFAAVGLTARHLLLRKPT